MIGTVWGFNWFGIWWSLTNFLHTRDCSDMLTLESELLILNPRSTVAWPWLRVKIILTKEDKLFVLYYICTTEKEYILSLLNDWNTSECNFISCPTNSRNSCMTLSQNWGWKSFNFIKWVNNFLSFDCRTHTFSWDMMRGSRITEFLTTLQDIWLLSTSFFVIVETNWITPL